MRKIYSESIYTVGSENKIIIGSIIEGEEDFVATFGVNNTPIYMTKFSFLGVTSIEKIPKFSASGQN